MFSSVRLKALTCISLAALAIGSISAPSVAQTTQQRLRGQIIALSGEQLSITTRDGATVAVTAPAALQPGALQRSDISQIKPNDFVASVAAPAADGSLQAAYVMIFPEAMRGRGEGHYDWDLGGGTTMTNATVSSVVTAKAERVLSLVYHNTPIEIVVPLTAPVLVPIPASRADLKPGARVFIAAERAADGSLTAQRIVVGKDGIDPPQ